MAAIVIEKRSELKTVTPMMRQYLDIKAEYEGYILFYRLGDFYECFFEDAVIASKALDLVLTGRECGDGKRAAMCGVPFHKADQFIGKLVDQGYKVGICEQVEDPKQAVGLVKREVIRVVTPGTVTDADLLREGQNNFLASICFGKESVGVCFADISTGDVITPDAVKYEFSGIFDEDVRISLWGYNVETVIAEKVETILRRGVFTTRPRDYYDVYILGTTQEYDKEIFKEALEATAEHRGSTELISDVEGILKQISESDELKDMWTKYQKKFAYASEISYEDVLVVLGKLAH